MSLGKFFLAIVGVGVLGGGSLGAQQAIHFGIGGGISTPVGKFGDTHSLGVQGLAAVIWGGESSIMGARIDYSTNQFNGRSVSGTTYGDIRLSAVTANIVFTLPLGSIKPYGMIGGGWYPYREAGDGKRDNDFGETIGAGLTFPFFVGAGFIEGRYHAVSGRATARTFVPVTVGILF